MDNDDDHALRATVANVDLSDVQAGDTIRALCLYRQGQDAVDLFRVFADGRIEVYGEPSTKARALSELGGLEASLRAMRDVINAQQEPSP
jgi:hypothetical protein